MTDPTTAATRLVGAAGTTLGPGTTPREVRAAIRAARSTPREQRAAARAEELTPRQERAIARGLPIEAAGRVIGWGTSPMTNADTAAGPGIELDTWPTDDDVPDARVLSVVDGVLGDAASALWALEERLDELVLRLAPALSADPEDDDGRPMADPADDPRSDLVIAIARLGLHADRLATRVRLTTERLDL